MPTVPRSGRDRDGVTSVISPCTVSTSPGRVGRGHFRLPPRPIMPSASGTPLSTRRRMVIDAVCQPLATSPLKNVAFAAAGSRWNGCGCGECRDLRLIERVGACHKRLTHEEIIEVEDLSRCHAGRSIRILPSKLSLEAGVVVILPINPHHELLTQRWPTSRACRHHWRARSGTCRVGDSQAAEARARSPLQPA